MNVSVPSYDAQFRVFFTFLAVAGLILYSCTRVEEEDLIIIPPPTYPLSRPVIGFGVITASYINLSGEPNSEGLSYGYMRRGSLVKVVERQAVNKQGRTESWVLVEGGYRGWVQEDELRIFDYEEQAKSTLKGMNQ
jgi:hypothetical protein